jgi:DMSO/TMAO reductase YedYZ heme-binding membrane subunit
VTENERRAEDMLDLRDLIVRGLSAIGLIAVMLLMLLAIQGA